MAAPQLQRRRGGRPACTGRAACLTGWHALTRCAARFGLASTSQYDSSTGYDSNLYSDDDGPEVHPTKHGSVPPAPGTPCSAALPTARCWPCAPSRSPRSTPATAACSTRGTSGETQAGAAARAATGAAMAPTSPTSIPRCRFPSTQKWERCRARLQLPGAQARSLPGACMWDWGWTAAAQQGATPRPPPQHADKESGRPITQPPAASPGAGGMPPPIAGRSGSMQPRI
jgi:hypothetical protein